MKGLTPKEFSEVLAFVQEYHKFAGYKNDAEIRQINKDYPNMAKWSGYGLNIKYIDSCYDSRTGDVWSVTFRINRFHKFTFHTNQFNPFVGTKKPDSWKDLSFFELIKRFLTGGMTDKQSKIFLDETES